MDVLGYTDQIYSSIPKVYVIFLGVVIIPLHLLYAVTDGMSIIISSLSELVKGMTFVLFLFFIAFLVALLRLDPA